MLENLIANPTKVFLLFVYRKKHKYIFFLYVLLSICIIRYITKKIQTILWLKIYKNFFLFLVALKIIIIKKKVIEFIF